jgi:23S rRNA pseudouridine1911/1915/1917 synthase
MNKFYLYQNFNIEILYEDNDIAILNKPSGLLTHKKSLSDNSPSLAESLKTNFKIEDDEVLKEGIVHRLDIDTSGIIIIAKYKEIKILFQNKFKNRELEKNYLAFSYGVLDQNFVQINKNISRQKYQRTKFDTTDIGGKNALTNVENLKIYYGSISKLNCQIITGRTHQIRVHLLSLGLPIIGDKQYQLNKDQKFRLANLPSKVSEIVTNFPRQALHSHKLTFIHPKSQKEIKITCDLPDDMKDLELNLQ